MLGAGTNDAGRESAIWTRVHREREFQKAPTTMSEPSNNSFASVRVYDSEGQLVTFSWGLAGDIAAFDEAQAKKVHDAVTLLRTSGFTTNPPDAKEGERIETVWYVVRRAKLEDNGHETPIIDLYMQNERVNYKFFSAYLNTTEEVLAFETVSGLKLSDLRLFDGETALQKESPKFGQFSKEAPKHPKVALSKNPYYNPEEEDVKKRKPQYKFSRWLDAAPATAADPKAEQSQSGQSGTSGTSASGQNAGSGKTDITPHWTTIEENRKKVIAAFEKAGATTQQAMIAAMQIIEPNVTRLGESKAKNVDEYIGWIATRYSSLGQQLSGKGAAAKQGEPPPDFLLTGEDEDEGGAGASEPEAYAWTSAKQKAFTQEVLALYPGLTEKVLFEELAIKNWIWHPNHEKQLVADVAKELGWKVRTTRVGYHDGGEKSKSFMWFETPVGNIQWWGGATEFTKMVSGSWARPNKVASWRELKAPMTIEPLVIEWEAKRRETDGSEYFVVVKATPEGNLDAILEGDIPPS